jgi:hypothetical protein
LTVAEPSRSLWWLAQRAEVTVSVISNLPRQIARAGPAAAARATIERLHHNLVDLPAPPPDLVFPRAEIADMGARLARVLAILKRLPEVTVGLDTAAQIAAAQRIVAQASAMATQGTSGPDLRPLFGIPEPTRRVDPLPACYADPVFKQAHAEAVRAGIATRKRASVPCSAKHSVNTRVASVLRGADFRRAHVDHESSTYRREADGTVLVTTTGARWTLKMPDHEATGRGAAALADRGNRRGCRQLRRDGPVRPPAGADASRARTPAPRPCRTPQRPRRPA